MRYLTHQFAHSETLMRARRWLIQAGITPDRILVNPQGTPRLTVAAEPGEVDSIQMIVRIAAMHDPDGLPALWDAPHDDPTSSAPIQEAVSPPVPAPSPSFPLSWHPEDLAADEELGEPVELQQIYRAMRP